MGRNVKRVDFDFDWFEKTKDETNYRNKIWFGYLLESIHCNACDKTGKNLNGKTCPVCWGEGKATQQVEPPSGEGWQMWEDCSEGTPISPVFKTANELATWLEDNDASAFGGKTATKEQWLNMISSGSSVSAVAIGGKLMSGVEAISREKDESDRIKEYITDEEEMVKIKLDATDSCRLVLSKESLRQLFKYCLLNFQSKIRVDADGNIVVKEEKK